MPDQPGRNRRASAALVLGALSGALAASTVLSTAYPVTRRLDQAEQALAQRHVTTAALVTSKIVDEDGALPPGTFQRMQVEHLSWLDDDGDVTLQGVALPDAIVAHACDQPTQTLVDGEQAWAVACAQTGSRRVIAAWSPPPRSQRDILWTFLGVSALVGIITAMGVLSLLRPLTNLSRALDRVRAGERGVRVDYTGLTELDDLVDRLNLAAKAMEEREDAIVARIEAVQQLARLVAHEVRNPLQSLELLTDLIASEDNAAERQSIAGSLHDEVSTLNAVVERLLSKEATSGALRLAILKQPMRGTIEHIIRLRQPEASSFGCRIETGEISQVAFPYDPALLGRSIENLVINAMQIVPRGYGLIRISVVEEDTMMAIRVEDNGPGVDPDFGAQIFEANVTTKERGTGLGLTLVRGVVEAHGGYIAYDDSSLGGARFTAHIPKVEVQPGSQAPSPDR